MECESLSVEAGGSVKIDSPVNGSLQNLLGLANKIKDVVHFFHIICTLYMHVIPSNSALAAWRRRYHQ